MPPHHSDGVLLQALCLVDDKSDDELDDGEGDIDELVG